MVRMEGCWWLQYCQLADKGLALLDKSNNTMGFLDDEDITVIVLPSAESLSDLTAKQRNWTPCVGVYVRLCVHSLCIHCSMWSVMHYLLVSVHVCTVQAPCHISVELTINTLVTFSAHTYSVLLTICCHM